MLNFCFEWYFKFFPNFDNPVFNQMDRAQYEVYESEADYDSMEQNPTVLKVMVITWINESNDDYNLNKFMQNRIKQAL